MYYYVGTVILRMRPAEFWHTTPRKLSKLSEVHARMNSPKKQPKMMTIDGVPVDMSKYDKSPAEKGKGVGTPTAFIDQLPFMP